MPAYEFRVYGTLIACGKNEEQATENAWLDVEKGKFDAEITCDGCIDEYRPVTPIFSLEKSPTIRGTK